MLERCFKRTKTPLGLVSIQKTLRYNTSQKLLESVPYAVSRRGGPDAASPARLGRSTPRPWKRKSFTLLRDRHTMVHGLVASGLDPTAQSETAKRRGGPRLLRALMGSGSGGEVQNTESLHMAMLTSATDPSSRWWQSLLSAFASVFLIACQLFILVAVIVEMGEPYCVSHTDCRLGEYCRSLNDGPGRCRDCSFLAQDAPSATSCFDSLASLSDTDSLDHTKVCIRCNWDTSAIGNIFNADTNVVSTSTPTPHLTLSCYAMKHCGDTDGATAMCDFLELNLVLLTPLRMIVLVLISLCLAVPLAEDMDESAVEGAVLEFRVLGGVGSEETTGSALARHTSALLIHMALRCRAFVLPPLIAGVAAISLVQDGFAAMNILLNLLAVSFITEVDGMVSALFISAHRRDAANPLVAALRAGGVTKTPRWIFNRVLAIACSVLIIVIILSFQGHHCDAVARETFKYTFLFAIVFGVTSWLLSVASMVWRHAVVRGEHNDTAGDGARLAFFLSINLAAWGFACVVHAITSLWNQGFIISTDLPFYSVVAMIFDSINGGSIAPEPFIVFAVLLSVAVLFRLLLLRTLRRGTGTPGQSKVLPHG